MSGYRAVEPAFCRACGTPWTPGAPSCTSCGEALLAAQIRGPEPHAVPRVKRVLIASGLVLCASWLGLGGGLVALEGSPVELAAYAPWLWSLAVGCSCALAVLTAVLWLPNRASMRPKAWLSLPEPTDIGLTLVLCLVTGGLGLWMQDSELAVLLYGLSPLAALGSPSWVPIVGALVALMFVELFLRGVVFDGLVPLAGRTNAAIGVAILSAVLYLHPLTIVLGATASALRLRSDSVWPGYTVGLAGLAGVALGLV